MTDRSGKDAIAILFLVGLAVLSWLPRMRGPIDLRWDGGAYYVLGTSLAQGKGYRLLNEPGEIQSILHPPMLPAVVALHQFVLRTSDFATVGAWLRRSYFALFVAYAIAVYFMLRRFLPWGYATPAAIVGLFQLQTIFVSDLCFPEIPFGLATVLFVLCNESGSRRARRFLSAPLAGISFALRTVGVALLAAWAVESLCRREFRQMGRRTLFAIALVLCWSGYIGYVESGREYQTPTYEYQRAAYYHINVSYARNIQYKDPFSPELGYASLKDRARRFLTNLAQMPVSLGEAVSTRASIWELFGTEFNRRAGAPVISPWAIRAALLFLAALIAGGIGLQWLRRQRIIPLYILFSLAVVCATPWPDQFSRYLVPLGPFLSLSLFVALRAGVEWAAQRFPARSRAARVSLTGVVVSTVLASQAAALFLFYARWHPVVRFDHGDNERIEYRLFAYQDLHRATDAGLDWLKGQTKGGEVVAATDPQWVYIRTGLKSVLSPFEMDAGEAQRLLDSVPVRYLIVDEGKYKKYTARVVAAYPDRWRRVYADTIREEGGRQGEGKFEIYERLHP